jgi:menaquinone-dependent protoporphyrinogen oxidase
VKELKSVLIVFTSRFGSTDEIAHEIADVLEKRTIQTTVINLRDGMKYPSLEDYDGIIVGSGIKMGRWTKESYNFLKRNQISLNSKILGVFVNSGEAANPKNYTEVQRKYLVRITNLTGVKANMMEAFGGVFDFSSSSSYSFLEKKIVRRLAKSIEGGIIVDDDKTNDFRDWKNIRKWAKDFSQLVNGID